MSELEDFCQDYGLPPVLATTLFGMGVFVDAIGTIPIKEVKKIKSINLKERRKFISVIRKLNY